MAKKKSLTRLLGKCQTRHRSYLDGELLHVLVVLDIVCNSLLNDLGSFLTILLGPLGEKLLVALLGLLLCRLSVFVRRGPRRKLT
jgi:hypothetical protein